MYSNLVVDLRQTPSYNASNLWLRYGRLQHLLTPSNEKTCLQPQLHQQKQQYQQTMSTNEHLSQTLLSFRCMS